MIETERLIIWPLSYNELCLYASNPQVLAKEMGYGIPESLVDTATQEAIETDLLPFLSDSTKDSRFYTMWIVVEKKEKTIIGGLCFHGDPDEKGCVEVGYGIHERYCNRGYATEALAGMIEWLKDDTTVATLMAETEQENGGSIRVLEKNGFVQERRKDTLLYSLQLRT